MVTTYTKSIKNARSKMKSRAFSHECTQTRVQTRINKDVEFCCLVFRTFDLQSLATCTYDFQSCANYGVYPWGRCFTHIPSPHLGGKRRPEMENLITYSAALSRSMVVWSQGSWNDFKRMKYEDISVRFEHLLTGHKSRNMRSNIFTSTYIRIYTHTCTSE